MKYATLIVMFMAMGAAGCGQAEPDNTEATEADEHARMMEAAAQANRDAQYATQDDAPRETFRSPGFFGDSRSGRRKVTVEDDAASPVADVPAVEPSSAVEPVKRSESNLVKSDAEAERKVRLAKLYIDNAASSASEVRSTFLRDKALGILKEVIEKYPRDPATPEARKLLAEMEGAG